ncbi:MAG TPA: TonB-dependent receptor [Blastocatellia bacterium]|nr:TonB-dependent receptor [Blastocatellia bacterium]
MRLKGSQLIGALILLAAAISIAAGQSNTAIVRGTVTDKTNAVVSGARVRLRNSITNYLQETETDGQGVYRLIDVPFNVYKLTVESGAFETEARDLSIRSNLAQQVDIQLGVAPVRQEVNVSATSELLEPQKTAPSTVLDRNWIQRFPTAEPSRSAMQIVATVPGWTQDANGRLHARGVESQIQYSIDGVPLTDTIADSFASAPDPRNFRSVEVSTSNIPAEYGNKLAGLVAVTTRSGLEIPKSGSVTLSGGSFSTFETSFNVGGHTRKFGYLVSGAGSTTARFLDPPAIENFHNGGNAFKSFGKLDYTPNERNLFRLNLFLNRQHFDVPNLPGQESAGQDQRRSASDDMESLSWEHTFSPNMVSYIAGYQRYNSSKLRSNVEATPVFAEQSRHHSNYGVLGSLTWNKNRHTIKTGFEYTRFPVTESFTFSITDLADLLEREPDLPPEAQELVFPNAFFFNKQRTGHEGSFYVQDHINATHNLTVDLGVRFDAYHFLVDSDYWSPRLGVAYHIGKTKTVLRASYNRFLETPSLENLLLSSSPETQIFSPSGEADQGLRRSIVHNRAGADEPGDADASKGAPVQPTRSWQVDAGFQQQMGSYVRLDADVYYRRMKSPSDATSFFETGIIFPATLDKSRSYGVETRLDLVRVGGFSGFASYTNLRIYGFAPLVGGLFLGEAVELRSKAGQRVTNEEDQRNTVVFEVMYDRLPGGLWMAFGGRHDSGFGIELEGGATSADFAGDFAEKILDRVNFERGFIKPHTVFDFSLGKDVKLNEHVSLSAQFNIKNIADNFYLISFESVSSGTTVGRPRNYSGKLSVDFK